MALVDPKRSILDRTPSKPLGGRLAGFGATPGGTKMSGGGAGGFSLPALPTFGGGGGGQGNAPGVTIDPKTGKIVKTGGGGTLPGGGGLPGVAGPDLKNFAQKDPRVEYAQEQLKGRYQQLLGREGQMDPFLQESIQNLRQRQSADTTARATDVASSRIRDQQAGQEAALASRAARTGSAGGGYGQLAEASQRAQAKAAADIQLGRERDLDQLAIAGHNILQSPSQLALAQSGQSNQMLGTLAGQADMGARLGLAQQGLGLEQWKATQDAAYKNAMLPIEMQRAQMGLQQSQMGLMGQYFDLLKGMGYGGY